MSMEVATYECVIEQGKVQLPENVTLPEKSVVYVVVPKNRPIRIMSPRLVHHEDAKDFEMEVRPESKNASV